MGQMGLRRISYFKVVKVAESNVELTEFGRAIGFANLSSSEVQRISPHNFVAVDNYTALRGAGATSTPRIIESAAVGDGRTPLESASRSLG
jgi:hypothetical protein